MNERYIDQFHYKKMPHVFLFLVTIFEGLLNKSQTVFRSRVMLTTHF